MNFIVYFFLFCVAVIPVHAITYDTLFFDNFNAYDTARAHFGDTTAYTLRYDDLAGSPVAAITNPDSQSTRSITVALPVSRFQGCKIYVSARVRAQGLSQPPFWYNGVKVMLVILNNDSTRSYPQAPIGTDTTFAWSNKGFLTVVPVNALSLTLVLGLEKVHGSVWFDDMAIRLISDFNAPARDSTLPIPRFHTVPKLRGAMITNSADSAAIAEFGLNWKGNCLRWQLGGTSYDDALLRPDFETLLAQEIAKFDKVLPVFRESGISVVLDMHSLSQGLFHDTAAQNLLIDVWKRLALRYKDESAVWAYDLANEPNEDGWQEGVLTLEALSESLVVSIRRIDANKVIIIEPHWGTASRFESFCPIGAFQGWPFDRIVYSFHFYSPFTLTHQGITGGNYPPFGAIYPGTIDNIPWNKETMRAAMQPAMDFQKKYRVPIYVGEFSCIRWANDHSAIRWLTDAISLFEEQGWDWTYHAYREFHGWSVEYSDSLYDMQTPLETDRKALLLSYFASNENPYAVIHSPIPPDTESSDIRVLPNPFNPSIRIMLGNRSHPERMDIYRMDGRRVWGKPLPLGSGRTILWNGLDLSGQATGSGAYVIRFTEKNQTDKQIKIIKLK